jgi:hypothetical protein
MFKRSKQTGKRRERIAWLYLALLAVLGLALFVIVPRFATTRHASYSPYATATVYYPYALQATAAALITTIPSPSPIPGLAPDKAASFQRSDQWRRAEKTALPLYPPPEGYLLDWFFTPVASGTPRPITPHRTAGAGTIWEERWNPKFAHMIFTANQWQQSLGDRVLVVWSGRQVATQNPQQGLVLVATIDSDTGELISGPESYLTPAQEGEVRIDDATGVVLHLRSGTGSVVNFDLSTRRWVSPESTPIPSISPSPSP